MKRERKLSVLIIDDERYSRDELRHLLTRFESIEIVGEADTGESGILKALQTQPDVVFLDMEMPQMNGLETAKAIRELKKIPKIIFATAYPDFAAEAFRVEALDYLLKPFDEDQLAEAVARLEKVLFPQENIPIFEGGKLAVEGVDEINYLDPKQLLYVYRDQKISRIVGIEKEYETKAPLKEIESRLKGYPFFRIHKSYLVNLDHVSRLIPWFNGAYQLEIHGRKEMLSVSRNYVKELRQKLEL